MAMQQKAGAMNSIKLISGIFISFLLSSTVQAQRYRITDLGTLPGGESSEANAIDDRGVAVGDSAVPEGIHAFVWTESEGMKDLGNLPGGGAYSSASGIN